MKIAYISKYANILKYGEDTRQFYFCKQFAKKGHNVTLIMSNSSHLSPELPHFTGDFKVEYVDGVKVVIINLPQYKKATSIKRFLTWLLFEWRIIMSSKEIFDEKQDVVIASSLSIMSIISGYFLKVKQKSKLIFEVRDIWPLTLVCLKKMSHYNPVILFLGLVEKFAYCKSDVVVGTMPGLSEHIKNRVKKNVNTVYIPQGVDLEFYTAKQEQLEDGFVDKYFKKDKFTVTYAGTLGVSYALDKVVLAAKILQEKGINDVQILLLGSGLVKEEIEEMIEKYKLDNVILVPRIPKTKVFDFLSKSSILLHSFKMEEVFNYGISPNKFIDYMYSARPIVVMFSGMPSIINQADCGEFIPSENSEILAETILKYKNKSKSELDEIGMRGKNYLLNNLTYEHLADKYEQSF